MTYFADLSRCEYFADRGDVDGLLAVGWLDADHPFPTGPIDHRLVARLFALTEHPWEPWSFLGYHGCELCGGPDRTPTTVLYGERQMTVGARNLFIPGRRAVYVTPSMVLHYALEHRYQPPRAFAEAVEACPDMRTSGYFDAVAQSGPAWLLARIHRK